MQMNQHQQATSSDAARSDATPLEMNNNLLDQAKGAISALSVPSETLRANEWLVEFERSFAAWDVATNLLNSPNDENGNSFRFFGAKFLYSKVQRQYFQLSPETVMMLAESLVQHILKLAQESKVEFNICRYLCLALSALLLQMNQQGSINQILQWLNPIITICPRVLLELLIVLPEECYNRQIDISAPTRNEFIEQLSQSSTNVLSFLATLWPSSSTDSTVRGKILQSASRWLEITEMDSEMLSQHPVYPLVLQTLTSSEGEQFEYAVDAVLVILQRFRARDARIVDSVLPVILGLRGKWESMLQSLMTEMQEMNKANMHQAVDPLTGQMQYFFLDEMRDELDEELRNTCRALCRLYAESAEACLDLFLVLDANTIPGAGGFAMNQQHLLQQLLECTKFPFDHGISRIPLKFFYDLAVSVQQPPESHHDNRDSRAAEAASHLVTMTDFEKFSRDEEKVKNDEEEKKTKLQLNARYIPVYQCLLQIALQHLVLPVEVLQQQQLSDIKNDMRMEWKETILDCCHVLGGSGTMELLCNHLQQEVQRQQQQHLHWGQVETILLCLQLAAPFMSRHDEIYISQVLKFAISLQLPENSMPLMRRTLIDLFGRTAFWLEYHPDFLPPILTGLVGDLTSHANASTAAKAIMNIFRNCSKIPNLPIEQLHNKVVELRKQSNEAIKFDPNTNKPIPVAFGLDSELLLLEALVVVAAHLPPPEAEAAFKSFMMPIATELNELLSNSTSAPDVSVLGPYVDRATVLLQYFRVDASYVVEVFVGLLPLFQRIFEVCPVEKMCEKSCRFYKHAMRTTSKHFAPFVPAMAAHLSEQFEKIPIPAFLYAGSTCFSSFSRLGDGSCVQVLYQMLWSMSTTFFRRFNSLQDFEQKPDVVEEYFYLMAKALQYCPEPFLRAQQEANTVMQAALTGLSIHHREAQKGVLMFLERVVELAGFWSIENNENLANEGNKFVKHHAPSIIQGNFVLLSGEMPAYALDEGNGCISDVLWHLRKKFRHDFNGWINNMIPNLSSSAQQVAMKLNIQIALDECKSLKEFSNILDRFELTCRRNI